MFGLNGFGITDAVAWQITRLELVVMLLAVVILYVAPYWRHLLERAPEVRRERLINLHMIILPLFILGILRLSAQSFSPFLYFQF